MPRRQRDPKRRRPFDLAALDGAELLALAHGWRPPRAGAADAAGRWGSWAEFLAAYADLRDAYLRRQDLHGKGPPFAEWLWQMTDEGDAAKVEGLAAMGELLTAERCQRYPALVVCPVNAAYRQHTSGCWDPATDYALNVIAGEVIVGRLVRLACARHLADLETGHERGLSFDADAGEAAGWFFYQLDHIHGEWARPGWNPLDPRLRLEDNL